MQTLKEKIVGAYEAFRKGVFIITSCLVIFIAFRNSLIWHLEEVWGASKSLWATLWGYIYYASGESPFNMFVIATTLVPLITFIIANAFFLVLDLTGKPAVLLKYKIQEEKHIPVNWEKYKKALKLIAFNITVVGAVFNYISYPLIRWRGNECGYELPSFFTTVWHLFCFVVFEEIGFYYAHRLFHHPRLYKHIHKIHHEWTAPTSVISVYAHPLEHFVANIAPMFFGPLVCGSHLSVAWLWYILGVLNTTISHSGYHLPFMTSNEAHDYHHLKFNENYGVMGVLDRLHGTDTKFRLTKNYERHIVLQTLIPARVLIPDPPKKGKDHVE